MFTARKKVRFILFLALILCASAYVVVSYVPQKKTTAQTSKPSAGQVAGITDGTEVPNSLFIRIPTNIDSLLEAAEVAIARTLTVGGMATFNGDVIMNGKLTLPNDVEAQGITLNLGQGTILASNLIYSIEPGTGIEVGPGQNPLITNTGVLSLQGLTGALNLEAGNGITLDGLKISLAPSSSTPTVPDFFQIFAVPDEDSVEPDSREDTITFIPGTGISISTNNSTKEITFTNTGSSPTGTNYFQTFAVTGQDSLEPESTEDTVTFVPGTGITITTDTNAKTMTINSSAVSDPETIKEIVGFEKNGAVVSLFEGSDNVGLGTTAPSAKLDVIGAIRLGAAGAGNILNTTAGSTPTGSLFWGDREICDDSGNCDGGASSSWSDLTDPTANLSLAMAGYTSTFIYGNNTSTANLFSLIDSTSNTGTGYLLSVGTAAGSSLNPVKISAQSNNVFVIDSTGLVSIGSSISNGKALQVTSDIGAAPADTIVNFALSNPTVNGHTVRLGFFEGTEFKGSVEAARETLDNTGYLSFKTRNGAIAEAMRIKADGNVGVGTSNPGSKFVVGNNTFQVSTAGDIIKIKNLSYTWPTSHGQAGAVLTNDNAGNLIWSDTSSSAGPWGASGNDVFPDSNTYNVGIGTNTTSAKLTVVGTSLFDGLASFPDGAYFANGTSNMTITGSNNGGEFSTPGSFIFKPTYDFAILNPSNDESRFVVKPSGNVGIGIQDPTSKFNVKGGDIRMTNAADANYIGFALPAGLAVSQTYTLPLLDGNNGDVLTTDSDGNLSWASVTGPGDGSTKLSDLSASDDVNTIANASFAQTWNWQLSGAGTKGLTIGETAASSTTGDAALLYLNTLSSSTAVPLHVANFGNGYSFRVDDQGSDSTPFIINEVGNVGVGTTTGVNAKLVVENTTGGGVLSARFSNDMLLGSSATNGHGLFFGTNGYSNTTGDYIRQTAVGTISIFGGGTDAGAAQLHVTSGNVGVGTAAPANKFAVGSSSQFQVSNTGDIKKINNLDYTWPTSHGLGNYVLTNDGNGSLNWSAVSQGSTTWSDIAAPTADLALGMSNYSTTFSYGSNTSTNNMFTITDANANIGTGYLFTASNGSGSTAKPFRVTANGGLVDAMMVSSTGNVGMGTTAPGAKLDVKGTFRLLGSSSGFVGFTAAASAGGITYTWPSDAGSNGQVLTTNNSGGLSWTSIAQSGGSAWGYTNQVIHLTTAGDAVGIGTTSREGKLAIIGDRTNEPVVLVKGPASHASNYLDVQNSGGTSLFTVMNSGNMRITSGTGISIGTGYKALDFVPEGNGANYFRIVNSEYYSPILQVKTQGSATDLDFQVAPLGTGNFKINSGNLLFGSASPSIRHANGGRAISFAEAGNGGNYFELYSNEYGHPEFRALGTLTDVDVKIVPKGAGNLNLTTGNLMLSSSTPSIRFGNNGTAIAFTEAGNGANYFQLYSNEYGNPEFSAQGSLTNLDIRLIPKGTGNVVLPNGNLQLSANTPSIMLGGGQPGLYFSRGGNGANYFGIYANEYGNPEFQALGNAANIDMKLVPKGTGAVNITTGNVVLTNGGVTAYGNVTSYFAGNVGIGTATPGTYKLRVEGDFHVAGACSNCSSDIRLKENIETLQGSNLSKLLSLRGVSYTWSDPTLKADMPGQQIGVIAQEVELVYPELVGTDSRGFKFVRYDKFIAPTIEALREQQAQIAALQLGPQTNPEENIPDSNYVLSSVFNQLVIMSEGSWTFVKEVVMQAAVTFEKTSTFIGQAVFKNKVFFKKEVVFASQMGGKAIIKTGDTRVAVTFNQPFSETPLVTLAQSDFYEGQYRVVEKTTQGFVIELSQVQTKDLAFDWQALRVDNVQTSQSNGGSEGGGQTSPTPSVVPEATPPATPEPSSTPEPTPSVEPSATPAPTPLPEEPTATESASI